MDFGNNSQNLEKCGFFCLGMLYKILGFKSNSIQRFLISIFSVAF